MFARIDLSSKLPTSSARRARLVGSLLRYNRPGANPMTTKTLMTVEEYLRTSFEDGDCEYVDGEIVEKNMGEYGHADIQGELVFLLRSLRSKPGLNTLKAMPEVRIRTGPSRYRVPDVAVWLQGETGQRIPTLPPFFAIEILSPDDRMTRVKIKISDHPSIPTHRLC